MALTSNTLTLKINIASQAEAIFSFFLNAEASVIQFETIEISHSSFSQSYFLVRNSRFGITATLEDGTEQLFSYYPMAITPLGNNPTLDQGYRIDLGDPGRTLSDELANIYEAQTLEERPLVIYRAYRSDDLTEPMIGPETLEVTEISFNREGATFEARAPRLNVLRTGEIYSIARFPTLRGFLK